MYVTVRTHSLPLLPPSLPLFSLPQSSLSSTLNPPSLPPSSPSLFSLPLLPPSILPLSLPQSSLPLSLPLLPPSSLSLNPPSPPPSILPLSLPPSLPPSLSPSLFSLPQSSLSPPPSILHLSLLPFLPPSFTQNSFHSSICHYEFPPQAVSLTVSPAVYDVTILYSDQERTGPCDTVTIGNDPLVLYPNTMTSDLQSMLNTMEAIRGVGGVMVEKREGQAEGGNLWVIFRILFLTGMGTAHSDIPAIDVSSDDNCSLNYNITAEFVQVLTTPTFQVGFPDSQRQTRPLPVINTTAQDLQAEMEMLLSYKCSKTAPSNVCRLFSRVIVHM